MARSCSSLGPNSAPLSVVARSTMMGRAASDDNAEQIDQLKFSRRPHPQSAAFLRFRRLFQSLRSECDMTIATHSFDALMDITARPTTVFVRGEGSFLWDDSGKRYLDFVQGWAVNCLGHSPPEVVEALAAQAKLLLTPSRAFYNAPSLKLAKALADHSCLDQVFFTNSGAEANEGAIKLARKYGALHRDGAYEIITFEGGFHGRTLATMSASGKKAFEPLFEPTVSGFPKAQLNDLASVERRINDKTVGVMLEPIQGEAGVWPATDGFLSELRTLTQ